MLKKYLGIFSAILLFSACSFGGIEGSWTEPVPGMPSLYQGFSLRPGGKAASINMATLQYRSWERKDNLLILSGDSIGNHQTIPFTETYMIKKITDRNLILKKGTETFTFRRHNQ